MAGTKRARVARELPFKQVQGPMALVHASPDSVLEGTDARG